MRFGFKVKLGTEFVGKELSMYVISGLGCAVLMMLSGAVSKDIAGFQNRLGNLQTQIRVSNVPNFKPWIAARPVVGKYGYADLEIDRFGESCLQWIGHRKGTFLDVASGYGLMTQKAFERGASLVVANEINPLQLAEIQFSIPPEFLPHLYLLQGRFPDDFPDTFVAYPFVPARYDVIYGGRLWHFLNPAERALAAKKMFTLAADDGVVFVTAATPFNRKVENDFWEIYSGQVSQKVPLEQRGLVNRNQLPEDQRFRFPEKFYLLIPDIIEQEFYDAGFTHVESLYYPEPRNRADNVFLNKNFSGLERAGVIAWKGPHAPFSVGRDPGQPDRQILIPNF